MKQPKKSTLSTFSARLAESLGRKEVTQQQVAAATGVAQSTISHYLRGTRATPRVEEILALAAYFDVSVEWLFGAKNSPSGHDLIAAPETNDSRLAEVETIVRTIEEQISALKILLAGGAKNRRAKHRSKELESSRRAERTRASVALISHK